MATLKIIFGLLLVYSSLATEKYGPRPDSFPYISGDTFRATCKLVFDGEEEPFDATRLRAGDMVFVETDYLADFFKIHHPQITVPYILISHNTDAPAPGAFKDVLDDPNLIAWFAQNCDSTPHKKLIPIPIGLSNKHWNHSREHDRLIETLRKKLAKKPLKRTILFYVNFDIKTSPKVRIPVLEFFRNKSFATFVKRKPFTEYLKDVAQSKFVLSPHGNGLDCHRTWEAMLLGSIPVVKTSTLDPLYADLPVLIIQDWSDVTAKFLEKKYKEMRKKTYNYDKLFMPYWFTLIEQYQKPYNKTPLNHETGDPALRQRS